MSEDLYQQAILDRAKTPSHAGRLDAPDVSVTVDNPLCGDRVTLDLKLDGDKVVDLTHKVRGCALCQASASVMADAVVGKTIGDARKGRDAVKAMFGGSDASAPWDGYGIFTPVRAHKSRQECVKLPLEALEQAFVKAGKT